MADANRYTVVEQAGYVGERDLKTLDGFREANDWLALNYSPEEIEEMRIEIAVDLPDGNRTYELI
jgi:hypothetical protein